MTLAPGTKLGPYEVATPLGAGGMGEVYRARDTRLGRDVAIKVLPQHLSANPEVRSRFEREAKTVSSLNHPNICTLFDVGREGDTDYLVMELIEGETLAQKLTRGALPPAEVLRLGTQIADALERAHRAGVVHRDLKPGNVMLTRSGAKLMDFGLARATGLAGPGGASGATVLAMTQSPTMAAPLTAEGTIVGTFQYMSPEQLEGKEADARSDIWALGCVLYEMATGRRAFSGASQASLIGAIMNTEPVPMVSLAPMMPPALERVVTQCLAKDPDERWQSAGDVRRALEWSGDPAASTSGVAVAVAPRRRTAGLRLALAFVGGVLLASLVGLLFRPQPPAPAAAILELPPAAGSRLSADQYADLAISPDGRWLAYAGLDSTGGKQLWVRALDSPNARIVPGTERAERPFWSPDSRWIGYFTTGENAALMKVPLLDGPSVKLCDIKWTRGGCWGSHGDLLFSPTPLSPIMRISENGGTVTAATALDTSRNETSHRHPSFLPDGDHFVFTALPVTPRGWTIRLGSLRSHAVKDLGYATSAATWVAPGYLVFDRDGQCVAQRLDPGRLELTGDLIPLGRTAGYTDEDATRIATGSMNGRIALLRTDPPMRRLRWFDRSGTPGAVVPIRPDLYVGPVLAHAGFRVIMTRIVSRAFVQALVIDPERGVITPLTDAHEYNAASCWSPDDRKIGLSSSRQGGSEEIGWIASDGSGESRVLRTSAMQFKSLIAWTPDQKQMVMNQVIPGTSRDLFLIDAERGGSPRPLVVAPGSQESGDISADGNWLVYDSDETGSRQLFLCRLPDGSGRMQLTTDGGAEPRFCRGGREILFVGNDRRSLYSMEFAPGRTGTPPTPKLLFRTAEPMDSYGWAVTGDGSRFLLLVPDAQVRDPGATIIVDWTGLVRSR